VARKLADTQGATIHQLPVRKARGAKSSGGRKPAAVSKPKPGESRPAAAKKTQPTDAEIRQGQQDRLIALHTRHRAVDNRLEVAKAAMSDIALEKKEVRAAIQNAGFPLATYDEAYSELRLKTKKTDLIAKEKIRGLIREALGLPAGPQAELDLAGVPEAARPALHWRGVGYQQALLGEFADPQRDGVPPEAVQEYMAGFGDVTKINARGLKSLKEEAPAAPPPPLFVGEDPAKVAAEEAARRAEPVTPNSSITVGEYEDEFGKPDDGIALQAIAHPGMGEVVDPDDASEGPLDDDVNPKAIEDVEIELAAAQPDWTDFSHDPDAWTELQTNAFLTWFAELGDEEVDIEHPGAAAMFDRCVAAEEGGSGGEALEDAIPHDKSVFIAGPAPAGVHYMLSGDEPFASGRQAAYRDGAATDTMRPGALPYYDEHPFEASEAELAAQKPRQALQERKQAEAGGFSDD
jgi:hypothetical protein